MIILVELVDVFLAALSLSGPFSIVHEYSMTGGVLDIVSNVIVITPAAL